LYELDLNLWVSFAQVLERPDCNRLTDAEARGLIDKRLHRKEESRMYLSAHLHSHMPTGALEVRTRGLAETDESYQHAGLEIHNGK